MTQYIERPFEVKSIKGDGKFTGYGSVFGEIDSYRDVVMPGAFNDSLETHFKAKGRKVPMLWQHNTRQPIGVYTEVREDDHGLYVEGEVNMDVQQGREAHALMKQGALSGLSIGYDTVREEWDNTGMLRKLFKVDLWEISPVTFPAGDTARVTSVKSIEGLTTLSEFEKYLRDAGFTKAEATAFVSRFKATLKRSDSAEAEAIAIKNALNTLQGITQ